MKFASFLSIAPVAALGTGSVTTSTTVQGSPVERIVKLLKDLQDKAEVDGKAEQEIYDKFACWCSTTSHRKSSAIEQARTDLRILAQNILKYKGTIAVLTAEIADLKKNIKQNLDEQDDATAVREKEAAAFQAESSEEKQAIAALQKAIQVLVGGTKRASFLQESSRIDMARRSVKEFLRVLPSKGALSSDHLSFLSTFSASSYAPQSESIQGILKDMYDTMTSNLESSTNAEAIANRQFESFIAIKQEELAALRASKKRAEDDKAQTQQMLADATETYDNTESQMKADIEFLDATKKSCEAKSDEWDVRKSLRTEELDGIKKAIEILTSDDARALFASSIKAGKETFFLQVASSETVSKAVSTAYDRLKSSARKAHSLRLAALAARVQESKVGHFDEVIKAIDDMIADLKAEGADDIAKRDQCKSEYQKQNSAIANINWLIEKNEAKIDKLERLIAKRKAQKAETIASIKDTDEQIKDMKKERNEEHEAFKHAKKEDEQTVELLKQARDALTAYSKKNGIDMGPIQGSVAGVFLNQEPKFEVSEDQAPEANFADKGSRKQQTKGIVGLMSMLLEDAEDEIKNGIKNEAAAQLDFEERLKAAKTMRKNLVATKTDLETQIANLGEKKGEEISDKHDNEHELKDEQDYLAKITPDCDWIIGAFEKRAAARAAEMDGLSGAKASLAGAGR